MAPDLTDGDADRAPDGAATTVRARPSVRPSGARPPPARARCRTAGGAPRSSMRGARPGWLPARNPGYWQPWRTLVSWARVATEILTVDGMPDPAFPPVRRGPGCYRPAGCPAAPRV
ncbi:hypothetical protein BJF79_41995 [Actinomadura sp. CNU-125]|uniref:hypothetical protein n=1 Tax=Actinomadura sp. CNU-125 TaxID=1904961 RepID=UPI00096956F9|nr:hypothetical protein [Actinomadura sp. CNU-125]OLT28081.1 hypothetical protein BJF79_41995 [Actinomadura sp. CNU-125]